MSAAPSPILTDSFHPAVAAWFVGALGAPTAAQAQAWPMIRAGRHTLVAAPTGSGKTLSAFLIAIDGLVRRGLEGRLPDETQVVYVSPLKALSNDIERNLEAPLAGIRAQLKAQGLPDVEIRTFVRTGDTPTADRDRARRRPPHIVVTTPESLYILLGSESGRAMLKTTRTVIVDEIHALAPNKRGAHLALSLERLDALCRGAQRIGLSATQKPIETIARFLTGAGAGAAPDCAIIDEGHTRKRELQLEVPSAPLEAVMSGEVWTEVYDRLAGLVEQHRTTLVFVNTRRMAERLAAQLSSRLGEANVTAHHGSMARELRLDAEQRLKKGALRALVATASLELGIDIGDVDLVCQMGSPRSIASFLQRVGRSGHAVGGTPKGRLFPLSRDELVECAALLDSVARGELDRLAVPERPLDVLSQQIVAEVAAQEWGERELFALFKRAWPYRDLDEETFRGIVQMLADGFTTRRGRRGALVHYDGVNHLLRGRRGARLTAITSGGAIPETADYRVLLEPDNLAIGTVNEDFAVESMAGDIFQLGNASYRIMRVERGTVRVEDARGLTPTIPFWLGEAPGRSDEFSVAVSRLRAAAARHASDQDRLLDWLEGQPGMNEAAAIQLAEYLGAAFGALGCLPTQERIVFERFFDEAGGMQLVIHSPYGSRLNRAWGLALRKRFCRKFNFELQAAATEDNIILSLTTAHSFDLIEASRYLNSASVRDVLIQAMLDSPMFITRWRWVSGISLALPRMRGGRKVPPQFARMEAEDLIAAVFPDQIACAENLVGEREVPDHPLVNQAIEDSLHDAMDITGLERMLARIEKGEVEVIACELTEPSPLALEILSAKPYAFLDDAPLEERRTQAVMARRWLSPENASDIGKLDAEAIQRVRAEAWPGPANADEMHDALAWFGFLAADEAAIWSDWLGELGKKGRAYRLRGASDVWVAAERLPLFRAVWPDVTPLVALDGAREWSREEALVEILRGRLEGLGPVTEGALAASLGVRAGEVAAALIALQTEGFAMRGRFTPGANGEEWCERGLLARIHRYTVKRLRAEIEPVAARDFLRFLFAWQHVAPDARMEGPDALGATVLQLEGFEAPAGAWEEEILPARVSDYEAAWLDDECLAGRISWARLRPRAATNGGGARAASPVRATPITLLARRNAGLWQALSPAGETLEPKGAASAVLDYIRSHGASFFDEIIAGVGLLRAQGEEALAELVALGLVTSDSFGGLRALLVPSDRRKTAFANARRRRRAVAYGMEEAGRWALARRAAPNGTASADAVEHAARTLLARYGVVFWRALEREAGWLPPWRDLLRVYRRLEARGEIRGGRFVAGFAGEQFALPDAIALLRETRRKDGAEEWIAVSGADPLNLVGILTPGQKLPALAGNRLLYRDGVPVASWVGGEARFHQKLDVETEWRVHKVLARGARPSAMAELADGAAEAGVPQLMERARHVTSALR